MTWHHPALAKRALDDGDKQISALKSALEESALRWDVMAIELEKWAKQSRDGGWSTHQVDANKREAAHCRVNAAHARAVLR
jgi:nitrate reductase assembly molybdenum cofactor insertion protein NarJ